MQFAARAAGFERWRDLQLQGLTATAESLDGSLVFHAHESGEGGDANWPPHRWTLNLDLTAHKDGRVSKIHVKAGDAVDAGQPLLTIE